MSYAIDNLEYSICKRIPDMEGRGFSVQTAYGEIDIDPEEGRAVTAAVRRLLERKLEKAKRVEAARLELAKLNGGKA